MNVIKNSVVLERLKALIDNSGKSRQVIARDLGFDTSTVTKQYNGDIKLSVDSVVKYAKYFRVSTDYLLGLSLDPTTDKDKAYICEYTGLSLAAIDKLQDVNKEYGDTVDLFIRSIRFRELMEEIDFYCVQAHAYGEVLSMGNVVDSRRTMKNNLNLRMFNIQEYSKEIAKEIYKKKERAKGGD